MGWVCPDFGRPAVIDSDAVVTQQIPEGAAYSFGISEPTAVGFFSMCIDFFYLQFGMIPIWPDWQDVSESMLKSFILVSRYIHRT